MEWAKLCPRSMRWGCSCRPAPRLGKGLDGSWGGWRQLRLSQLRKPLLAEKLCVPPQRHRRVGTGLETQPLPCEGSPGSGCAWLPSPARSSPCAAQTSPRGQGGSPKASSACNFDICVSLSFPSALLCFLVYNTMLCPPSMNYLDAMPHFEACSLSCPTAKPEARKPFTAFVPSPESRASITPTARARPQHMEARSFPGGTLATNLPLGDHPFFFFSAGKT